MTRICRNCNKPIYSMTKDYYGFCCLWCYIDFKAKHILADEQVKEVTGYEVREQEWLEEENRNLDYQVDDLESENRCLRNDIYEKDIELEQMTQENEDLKDDNLSLQAQNEDLLEVIKKLDSHSERFQMLDLGQKITYEKKDKPDNSRKCSD